MHISSLKIDVLIARKCLTQAETARLAGLSRQCMILTLKRGRCTARTAGKIARALGVDVTEIMEDVGIDNSKGF